MLITVGEREFHRLVLEKEDIIAARTGFVAPLMAAITMRWMSELDVSSTLILSYLITRTVGSAKAAERITIREFVEGPPTGRDTVQFQALPVSESTLRKQVKALCDKHLINIYRVESGPGSENQARMFEIDCKHMLDVPTMIEGRDLFLAQIEERIALEKGVPYHPKLTTPPH